MLGRHPGGNLENPARLLRTLDSRILLERELCSARREERREKSETFGTVQFGSISIFDRTCGRKIDIRLHAEIHFQRTEEIRKGTLASVIGCFYEAEIREKDHSSLKSTDGRDIRWGLSRKRFVVVRFVEKKERSAGKAEKTFLPIVEITVVDRFARRGEKEQTEDQL